MSEFIALRRSHYRLPAHKQFVKNFLANSNYYSIGNNLLDYIGSVRIDRVAHRHAESQHLRKEKEKIEIRIDICDMRWCHQLYLRDSLWLWFSSVDSVHRSQHLRINPLHDSRTTIADPIHVMWPPHRMVCHRCVDSQMPPHTNSVHGVRVWWVVTIFRCLCVCKCDVPVCPTDPGRRQWFYDSSKSLWIPVEWYANRRTWVMARPWLPTMQIGFSIVRSSNRNCRWSTAWSWIQNNELMRCIRLLQFVQITMSGSFQCPGPAFGTMASWLFP